MKHAFTIVFRWRRRNTRDMQLDDDITKIDVCDFAFRKDLFELLQEESKVMHTVNAFATTTKALLPRFLLELPCLRMAGEDYLRESLEKEDAWLHPPCALIGRTIKRLMICRARS